MNCLRLPRWSLAVISLLTGSGVTAQKILAEFRDPIPDAFIGRVVACAGDANGDGVADIQTTTGGSAHPAHAVYLLSGKDGAVLTRVDGNQPRDFFGFPLRGGTDLDGDGAADFLVGATLFPDAKAAGRVSAFSGRDGRVLYEFDGEVENSYFGNAIDLLEDLDSDGVAEILIGAPYFNPNDPLKEPGRAYVYSGASGALLHRLEAPAGVFSFAQGAGGIGDLEGDGHEDFAITAWKSSVRVYSGKTGTLLREFSDDPAQGVFSAFFVGRVGDLDQDGTLDVLASGTAEVRVGAMVKLRARAVVFSGASGSALVRHDDFEADSNEFPLFLALGVGDVNGDGMPEVLLSGPGGGLLTTTGIVRLLSGRSGLPLYEHRSDYPDQEAIAPIAAAGDTDGDGLRARPKISITFRIRSLRHLRPLLNREFLSV